MATYYFDSVLGNDSTGNGSMASPWAQYDNKYSSISAGDILLFKRGTTQSIATQYRSLRSGTSITTPFRMGAYGEGANPKFIYTGVVWGYMLNLANSKWIRLDDLDFDCQNLNQGALYVAAQGTGLCTSILINRCRVFNAGFSRSGIAIVKDGTATTATLSDIEVNRCDFFDNGEHGVLVVAGTNIRIKKCRAWRNGATATYGGHGFSMLWHRTIVTLGWTLVSGSVYKRTLTAAEASGNVTYIAAPYPYDRMTKNTGTPTMPGVGEFGVSAGELYININANPVGKTINFAWGRCGDNLIEDCVAFANIANPVAPYTEGHGIALDDFTEDSIIRRCKSFNNEGLGISINRGDRNTVEDCLAYGNGINGLAIGASRSNIVRRSTFANNNLGNSIEPNGRTSEIAVTFGEDLNSVSEVVLSAKSGGIQYGIDFGSAGSSSSVSKCNITGYTTPVRTIIPTGSITANPLLSGTYRPQIGSPLFGAGVHLGYTRDVEGKQRQNPPCIGAFDAATVTVV